MGRPRLGARSVQEFVLMPGNRYGRRALAVGGLAALGLAVGIWWSWSPVEVNSPQEMTELLPADWQAPFRARYEGPVQRNSILAAMETCGPVPVVEKFRTREPAAFMIYDLDNRATVQVAAVRLAPEDRASVQDALRTSTHCQRPASSERNAAVQWTKVARPWFGEASALFRVSDTNLAADSAGNSVVTAGSVWSFTMSEQWLVAIGGYRTSVETVASVYPQLLGEWDREVGTHFLAPGESRSDCGSPGLDDLPTGALRESERTMLASAHDLACQGQVDVLRSLPSVPLVVDNGFATEVDIGDPAEFARLMETRAVYRNGAISFRQGDSALVFSTLRPGELQRPAWDAYVQRCSTATALAAQMCGPDPYGPLGSADWSAVLADTGCEPDSDLGPIRQALFQDVTGDGQEDAILALLCDAGRGEVRIYDGASPPESPELVQSLLGDDLGPMGTGLSPVALTTDGGGLTVESEFASPDALVIDRFRWQDGSFAPVAREVQYPR
ncbi:hypothetical protein MOQ72_14095 [Saccharopolyspora sp. K220]|uniref:hypothetical protein n=1 Tax=Saccharopolyspora soli TaxID=2926618 RepID=UPI001F5AA878|nr:hypothetical protein [Saccharopolyspora soli]MCI2418567.1 hypothetical protein [Saccharopolyspora soli]